MASIDDLKQMIQQNFIRPLHELPKNQIKLLDTTHDQSVKDFQNAIGSLFLPPTPFEGSASDALSTLASNYYQAEQKISDYSSGGVSEHMGRLLKLCENALSQVQPLMDAVKDNAALSAAGTFVAQGEQKTDDVMPPGPEDPAWDLVQIFLLVDELLKEEPGEIEVGSNSDTYWYFNIEIDGKYYTIGIAVSKDPKNPGRVVSVYPEEDTF